MPTTTIVKHKIMRVNLPTAYLPITCLSVQMMAMNTSNTGKMTPFTNCAVSMIPIKSMLGTRITTAETTMTNVKMPLKRGASFQVNETPASQPNASQITKAVVRGRTHAASKLAATRPMANSALAYWPAKGSSAAAAASALSTSMPCGNSTVPVVTMINHATIQPTTAPVTASMR